MVAKRVEAEVKQKAVKPYEEPIRVAFVKLAEPIGYTDLNRPTTLEEYLNRRDMQYTSAVRVNRQVVAKDYILRNRDMITLISKAPGGTK